MFKASPRRVLTTLLFVCLIGWFGCTDSDGPGNRGADSNPLLDTLDAKLERQFTLYDEARGRIVERVGEEGGVVEREEWEAWLALDPDHAIDEEDLAELEARQQQAIEQSRNEAVAASALNLDLIRGDEERVLQYCGELPKGGLLHIHPSGTRNEQTIEEILAEVNPVVDGSEILLSANDGDLSILYPDEIAFLSNLPVRNYLDYSEQEQAAIRALFFLPDEPPTHDFKRFEAIFSISDLLDQDPTLDDWVEEKTYLDFLERAASQNVEYVEFTRVMWPDRETFEQLHTWAEDWLLQTGITVRWNTAFVRTLDYDTNTTWTQELIALLRENEYPELVGIDLLANETNTPALETGQNIYIPILDANQKGEIAIHRTMHAGELGLVQNVRDAMIMGAERVGHGVLLAQDPVSLEYAGQVMHLPVEINLYSNFRLQVVEDFSNHPFLNFLRLGLPVSLSTDDEGMFVTDITNECRIAVTYTDITHAELKQMSYNSLETAFAEETVKEGLIHRLDDSFADFETEWDSFLAPQ